MSNTFQKDNSYILKNNSINYQHKIMLNTTVKGFTEWKYFNMQTVFSI